MARNRRVLILAEGGTLAHPTRCAKLAALVARSGAEVVYGTSAEYLPYIGDLPGVEKITISSPPTAEVLKRLDTGKFFTTTAELESQFHENIQLLERFAPTAAIGDVRMTLPMACKSQGVPCLTLVNQHWSTYVRSRYPVPDSAPTRLFGVQLASMFSRWLTPLLLTRAIDPLNQVRERHGFPKYRSMREAYCDGDFVLYVGLPQQALPSFPANHVMVGPLVWESTMANGDADQELMEVEGPAVFVSLGSSGDQTLVPRIAKAFSDWPGTLIVTHAAPDTILKIRPRRTIVRKFIPVGSALRVTDLMIGNGGTATILAALTTGKPYLALYTNLDQALSVEEYARTGAVFGDLSLTMNEERIRSMGQSMLGNCPARSAAETCRSQFEKAGGDEWTVNRIREVLDRLTSGRA